MIRTEDVNQIIKLLNEIDECEDIEAKLISGSDLGRSVFETICALSNEPSLGGGTILLGVECEEALFPFYNAVGVTDPDRLSSDLQSACSTKFNQPVRPDITPVKIGNAVVIRVDVPELATAQKPLYFKSTGLPRGAYRRIGSSDVRCTDEDLSAFFLGQAKEAYDTRIVKEASWEDIDPTSVSAYRRALSDTHASAEHLNWSDEEMLYSLGALRKIEDVWRVTIAGILVFGKTTSLRRLFPTMRVDYIRVPGNTWVADPDERFDSLDMRGSLITLISRVIAAITDDLPKTFVVEDGLSGQRTETPVLPTRVIREAVVNCLMHRSYEVFEPVQIIRYANRLEIKNPGYSLKSQDRFDDPGSAIRNPTIAAVLHDTRFAETKGSGIRVMQKKMNESGLASPTFISDRTNPAFTATFLFHHFLDESDWKWLQGFKEMSLSEDQMKALIFVREVGAIDNATYRSLNRSETLAASKSLRALCQLNLLEDRGGGPRSYYVPGPEMVKRGLPISSMDAIPDKSDTLDGTILDSSIKIDELPKELRVKVRTAQMKSRLDPKEARHLIWSLCSWKELSLIEVATLLGKNKSYVSNQYIAPMVAESELQYKYPEMIKHPDQKYIALRQN